MHRLAPVLIVCSCVVAAACAHEARATTVVPPEWQELACDAAFIGIVECQTAGGVVAEYRVVESWFGPPAGTRFNLRIPTNYWEPQFGLALCGERYVVTAFKVPPSGRTGAGSLTGDHPLWWRKIPADYELTLFYGRVRLPLRKETHPLEALGSKHPDLESYRKAVKALVGSNRTEREALRLRALADRYVFGLPETNVRDLRPELAVLRNRFQKAPAKEIVLGLLAHARRHPEGIAPSNILWQAGEQAALDVLEDMPPDDFPGGKREWAVCLLHIRSRLGLDQKQEDEEVDEDDVDPMVLAKQRVPTADELDRMRHLWAKAHAGGAAEAQDDEAEPDLNRACVTLILYDPGPVAQEFAKWKNPEEAWTDVARGYFVGSYFAHHCGKDRAKHLRTLLKAHDPFIRVSGAVYLTFENEQEGLAALKKLTTLKGDPGVWAALTLARRGDTSAVPRLLEVFATPEGGGMEGAPHERLQDRTTVLLSNVAKASGLPQPKPPEWTREFEDMDNGDRVFARKTYESYINWWKTHGAKVKLVDPWFEALAKQKVD